MLGHAAAGVSNSSSLFWQCANTGYSCVDIFLAIGIFPHVTHALQYHQGQTLLVRLDVPGLLGVIMGDHKVQY